MCLGLPEQDIRCRGESPILTGAKIDALLGQPLTSEQIQRRLVARLERAAKFSLLPNTHSELSPVPSPESVPRIPVAARGEPTSGGPSFPDHLKGIVVHGWLRRVNLTSYNNL